MAQAIKREIFIKMQNQPFGQTEVGTSQFYMIRCVFAIAHADGLVSEKERIYADTLIERMPFNAEQKATLHADLLTPQDVSDMLRYVNDPKYRGQVVYFARLMAYKDGHLHPNENEILEHLHLSVTQNLDMDSIRNEARTQAEIELNLHDLNLDKNHPDTALHGLLDRFLMFCGIDLMRE
jgi:uncharacterized membrane protein YebE (DUF533 family)